MSVPADKAASNVIVVCKKYYLDVVMKELNSTKTYVKVNNDSVNVVSRHLDYMVKNGVDVNPEQEELPSFYWLPNYIKHLMALDS